GEDTGAPLSTTSAAMYTAHATTSTRYSTAASINIELQTAIAIADHRPIALSPERRIHTFASQNVAIHNGTWAMRIHTIAAAPGLFVSAANGANRYHCSGVWCSQKSRYGTRPWRTQSVARKNSISSQFNGRRPGIGRRRTAS